MELRHLRYFVAVAEEAHITRAAERLGMQQPPLSQQIKALERELDVQLLRRKPRGVELTDCGRVFLEEARAILAHLNHATDVAQRTARGEQGRISIGYTSAAAFHPLVQRVNREFREAYPLVSMTLAEDSPFDLVKHLQNGQIDVAYIRTPIPDLQAIVIHPLHREAMIAALPSGHALARKGGPSPSLKDLAGNTFIAFGNAHTALSMQSNALVAACQKAGFTPHIGHVAANNLSRLNLVAAGLGIAVVSAAMQRMSIEGVVYRRLNAPQLKIPLDVASRRGDASAAVQNFIRLAKRTARTFRMDWAKRPRAHRA